MTFHLTIPEQLAGALQLQHGPDLSRAALETFAIDGYRNRSLSRYQVQQLLGFSNRFDTESWLGDHGVTMNYGEQQLEEDGVVIARKSA
ncbi:hypothetical protein BH11PLA2_BH11PLA2_19330 [soil metagenome]